MPKIVREVYLKINWEVTLDLAVKSNGREPGGYKVLCVILGASFSYVFVTENLCYIMTRRVKFKCDYPFNMEKMC